MDPEMFKRLKPKYIDDEDDLNTIPKKPVIKKPKKNILTLSQNSISRENDLQTKSKRNAIKFKWIFGLTIFIGIILIGISIGIYVINSSNKNNGTAKVLANKTSTSTISTYFPQNLPQRYKFNNDAGQIQTNVIHFTITADNGKRFSVTQQSIPTNFDFNAFSKKFINTDNFTTNIGSVVAGQIGNTTIASIRTNDNTWIIINPVSPSIDYQNQVEAIARSFIPAKLQY